MGKRKRKSNRCGESKATPKLSLETLAAAMGRADTGIKGDTNPRGIVDVGCDNRSISEALVLNRRVGTEIKVVAPPPSKSEACSSYNGCQTEVLDEENTLFRQQPLLISVILQTVFKHLDPTFEELKGCRLVCKTWNEATRERWRKCATLKLLPSVYGSIPPERDDKGLTLKELVQMFETTNQSEENSVPKISLESYRRFKIKRWDFSPSRAPADKEFCAFWDIIGPSVEYLSFEKCLINDYYKGAFMVVVFEKCPNLKTLVLSGTNLVTDPRFMWNWWWTDDEGGHVEVPRHPNVTTFHFDEVNFWSFYVAMIQQFPKVEDLKICLREVSTFDASYCMSPFKGLQYAVDDGKRRYGEENFQLRLKHLDVRGSHFFLPRTVPISTNDFFLPLQNFKFPLESFAVDLSQNPFQLPRYSEQLEIFVKCFAETLKVFKVYCRPLRTCQPTSNFPFDVTMNEMRELYMSGHVTDSFYFLKFMPKLRVLWVDYLCLDKWKDLKKRSSEGIFDLSIARSLETDLVRNVRTLGYDLTGFEASHLVHLHINSKLSQLSIETLGAWMPNLKVLEVHVRSRGQIHKICESWPNLRELVLLRDSRIFTDSVTGLPQKRLKGLVDLKCLTKFGLEFMCRCNPTSLTDAAIYDGFLKMERLQSLSIVVDNKVSQQAIEDLSKTVNHTTIFRKIKNGRICPHQQFFLEFMLGT